MFKKDGCEICSEKEQCCLSAHHVDDSLKRFNIAAWRIKGFRVSDLRDELTKCLCLCENCHRKVHAGKLSISHLVDEHGNPLRFCIPGQNLF